MNSFMNLLHPIAKYAGVIGTVEGTKLINRINISSRTVSVKLTFCRDNCLKSCSEEFV